MTTRASYTARAKRRQDTSETVLVAINALNKRIDTLETLIKAARAESPLDVMLQNFAKAVTPNVTSAILERLDSIEASRAKKDYALTIRQAASEFKISAQDLRFLVHDKLLSNVGSKNKMIVLRHELENYVASTGAMPE